MFTGRKCLSRARAGQAGRPAHAWHLIVLSLAIDASRSAVVGSHLMNTIASVWPTSSLSALSGLPCSKHAGVHNAVVGISYNVQASQAHAMPSRTHMARVQPPDLYGSVIGTW